jgi:hypothetical protein
VLALNAAGRLLTINRRRRHVHPDADTAQNLAVPEVIKTPG